MSRYDGRREESRERPARPMNELRRIWDAGMQAAGLPVVQPISIAQQFDQYVTDVLSGKPLVLPVQNAHHEIHGDPVKDPENCITALKLDTLNGGRTLTLLIDWKFWRFTLSLLTDAKLRLEDGRVFLRYSEVAGITHRKLEDQWLGNLVTGRVMDYHSVRARPGDTVIDYRKQSLEVRQDVTQKAEGERLKVAASFNTENPEYPMQIGGSTVALGGTTQQTVALVNPDQPKIQPIVGIFKYGDVPKTTRFGKRVKAGHEKRQGVNAGTLDQQADLTKALMEVPTEAPQDSL